MICSHYISPRCMNLTQWWLIKAKNPFVMGLCRPIDHLPFLQRMMIHSKLIFELYSSVEFADLAFCMSTGVNMIGRVMLTQQIPNTLTQQHFETSKSSMLSCAIRVPRCCKMVIHTVTSLYIFDELIYYS